MIMVQVSALLYCFAWGRANQDCCRHAGNSPDQRIHRVFSLAWDSRVQRNYQRNSSRHSRKCSRDRQWHRNAFDSLLASAIQLLSACVRLRLVTHQDRLVSCIRANENQQRNASNEILVREVQESTYFMELSESILSFGIVFIRRTQIVSVGLLEILVDDFPIEIDLPKTIECLHVILAFFELIEFETAFYLLRHANAIDEFVTLAQEIFFALRSFDLLDNFDVLFDDDFLFDDHLDFLLDDLIQEDHVRIHREILIDRGLNALLQTLNILLERRKLLLRRETSDLSQGFQVTLRQVIITRNLFTELFLNPAIWICGCRFKRNN